MRTLQKFFSTLLISTLLLPAVPVFAGGSSMSYEVKGAQISAQPGKTLKDALVVNIKTYFGQAPDLQPELNPERLVIKDFKVACYGDDILNGASLRWQGRTLASTILDKEGPFYVANFSGLE